MAFIKKGLVIIFRTALFIKFMGGNYYITGIKKVFIRKEGARMSKSITQAILEFRDEYLEHYASQGCNSYYDINNGDCVEFADEFIAKYSEFEGEKVDSYENKNFLKQDDDSAWSEGLDVELLEKYWEKVKPIYGLTWDDMNQVADSHHCFLYHKGKFYDAECPEGVENFFELPLYRRPLKQMAEGK